MGGYMQMPDNQIAVPRKEELEGYANNNKRTSSVNNGGKFRRQSNSNVRGSSMGGSRGGASRSAEKNSGNVNRRSFQPEIMSQKQSKIYELVNNP